MQAFEASLLESERQRRKEIRRGKRRKLDAPLDVLSLPTPFPGGPNRGIVIQDSSSLALSTTATPMTVVSAVDNTSQNIAMATAFELVIDSGDCAVKSPKRKLLQDIQVMSFTSLKVVFGTIEEHCASKIRLMYSAPDQEREVPWVHDTSLAAL